tara:strand:- start:34 stop:648 length:615 start_codon:yes stop_codon:yes gene_type:complete
MQMRRRNGAYGGIPGYNQGSNPLDDYSQIPEPPQSSPYQDQIPGYNAGDNPLGDIPPESNPNPEPPASRPYQDQIPGYNPEDNPLADVADDPPSPPGGIYVPPVGPEVRPGDFDGDGIPNESDPDHYITDESNFQTHLMYDPVTGKAVRVTTYEEHLRYESLGYTHEDPGIYQGSQQSSNENDYALIGVISLLFFGGLILGIKR